MTLVIHPRHGGANRDAVGAMPPNELNRTDGSMNITKP